LETFQSALYDLKEVERDLRRYQDSVEVDTERLETIEERIELLRTLKRKYGDSIAEVLDYRQDVGQKLERLAHSDEHSEKLSADIQREESRLKKQSARLSELRARAAKEFQTAVTTELRDLALEKARFEVRIERGEPTARGEDRAEFQISTNPGEPLRPLARVASGGEISRVMLAIKSALARQEALPTMVFDEIDVGVGGRTATSIADKMMHLSRSAQILCITHLPQIAGRADHHFSIEKQVVGERTYVTVSPLSPEQRVEEIARMLGGTQVTEAVLEHAREMLAVK
jgi:DNA repair protein RecN (Recombination protein N)